MRPVVALLTALTLALGAAACSDDEVEDAVDTAVEEVSEAAGEVADTASELSDLAGFCTAAYRTQDAIEDREPEDALEAAEDLVAEAPEDIRPQAETVLEGAQAFQEGDEGAIEDEGFQTAVTELVDYTQDRCDPRS